MFQSLKQIAIDELGFFDSDFDHSSPQVLCVYKWNIDYKLMHEFQLKALEFVQENKQCMVLVFCNHPACYTMGRGLQKLKTEAPFSLIEFNPDDKELLQFPLHEIKRGGGLTFHYPGQLIFYPIVPLQYIGLGVHDLMVMTLDLVCDMLDEKFHLKTNVRHDLLGLWYETTFDKFKLASMGLAVSKYVTYHGLALNFLFDQSFFEDLKRFYPCGLPGNIYRSVDKLTDLELQQSDLITFTNEFKDRLLSLINQRMMDKHKSSSAISDSISSLS